jgi:hypothetical protein
MQGNIHVTVPMGTNIQEKYRYSMNGSYSSWDYLTNRLLSVRTHARKVTYPATLADI